MTRLFASRCAVLALVVLASAPAAAWNDNDWRFKKAYLKVAERTASLAVACSELGYYGAPDGLVGEISSFLLLQGEPDAAVRLWREGILRGKADEVKRVFSTLWDFDVKRVCNRHMRKNMQEFRAVAASEPEGERKAQ